MDLRATAGPEPAGSVDVVVSGDMQATSDAREELRTVVREFLTRRSPVGSALELMESPGGYDRSVWAQMSGPLALPALAIPERYGGQGFSFRELAIVLEELGRVVYMGPLFGTAVLAVNALLLSGDEDACRGLLPKIAAGARTATVALFEPGSGWATDRIATRASRDGDGWRLSGSKDWVIDGADADLILVAARSEDGAAMFAVERSDQGVATSPIDVMDLTRPLATVRLENAYGTRVGSPNVLPDVLPHALAGLACEQAGGADACLDMTVSYASERIQFGRPIGSYQAVRHRCADMFVQCETARVAARNAARAVAENRPDRAVAVGVAKSYCSEAFLTVAQDTVQLHGGLGFTWEHPAHMYFKRAKSAALMFGDPAWHRARIAHALLEAPRAA
jgi:alkylation response protein AidB-like acyl-CoA dehydrogenase